MNLLDTATRPLREAGRIGGWAATQGAQAIKGLRGGDEQQAEQRPQQEQQAQAEPQRTSSARPKDLDDVTIARKVETILFRTRGVDGSKIDVNVVDGVVFLRGVARTPQQIKGLETKARAIPEVADVQNLLHLPKTPAPTRADTPKRAQATRRKTSPPAKPRTEPRRLNADKTVQQSEDLPETLARTKSGRRPAKMGSKGEGSDSTS